MRTHADEKHRSPSTCRCCRCWPVSYTPGSTATEPLLPFLPPSLCLAFIPPCCPQRYFLTSTAPCPNNSLPTVVCMYVHMYFVCRVSSFLSQVDAPFRTTSAPPSEQAQFHYQQLAWRNQTQMQMNNSNNVPGGGAGGGQPGPVPAGGPSMAPKAAGGGGAPQHGQPQGQQGPQGGQQQVLYRQYVCRCCVVSICRASPLPDVVLSWFLL